MLTPISVFERVQRIDGGKMELWLSVRDIARRIVEANALRPLSTEEAAIFARRITQPQIKEPVVENPATAQAPQMKSLSPEAMAKIIDPDIRGGMRTPHLHLDGKIFLLEGKAYQEFSKQLITTVQERISAAGSIPFNQLLDVSEAAIGI